MFRLRQVARFMSLYLECVQGLCLCEMLPVRFLPVWVCWGIWTCSTECCCYCGGKWVVICWGKWEDKSGKTYASSGIPAPSHWRIFKGSRCKFYVYFRFTHKQVQYIYLLIAVSFSGYNKKDVGSEGKGYLWKADDKNEEDEEEQRQSLWGKEEFSVVTWEWADRLCIRETCWEERC